VRNVALVPKSDVLESSLRVRPHHARQSGDLFAGDGIAFVRHGRRTLLLFAEEFLGLADFRALQVPNLGGDLVERGSECSQGSKILGVAVAAESLATTRQRLSIPGARTFLFEFGRQMSKRPYRTRELAHPQIFPAAWKRVMFRCVSENQLAILKPKVMGSAWTP